MLDVMMSDLDGRTTLQHLKANPKTQLIPVILATAKVQSSDQDSFTELEVAAIVAKLFRPLNLPELISAALGWS